MSDKMIPLPIEKLFTMTFKELKDKGSIFGIPKELFFDPKKHSKLKSIRYQKLLDTPLGVAAGPHTQLSQNIIAAWLVGARYIELKTVQTLDELEVSKPCIDMGDEGYNCEWSQELKLNQSFEEYLNAWIMIHILQEELQLKGEGIDGTKGVGTIFNMSVGYNLEGIMNENVQNFLAKMKDCSSYKKAALNRLSALYPKLDKIGVPDMISDNITLSTMHGCPPDEIEKIGLYLINDLKVHTTIKLNPTLNGPKDLRGIINDKLGFKDILIPDLAFEHDLKYPDGIKIISNLKERAKEVGVDFSIKLTNTLETMNMKGYFDRANEMMYMSGRPLHASAINLAKKLQNEFKGTLDISFSSGADAFNIVDILGMNIKPITVCSDLLKPGGYTRLLQYADNITAAMEKENLDDLDQIPLKRAASKKIEKAIQNNLQVYLAEVLENKHYHKESFPWESIKTTRELKAFDCIEAPCESTCPTKQGVSRYIQHTALGEFDKALEVIRESNPFPNTTGMACDHICEDKCTRLNYDDTLKIRDIKRFVAMNEKSAPKIEAKVKLGKKIAIVGGGPSGLSAAFYLALEGFGVEIFEARECVGGMISHILPQFRADREKVQLDIDRILSLGVKIHNNHPVKKDQFKKLQKDFDYIYLSVGAQNCKKMGISGEETEGVLPFLTFLEDVKSGKLTKLPKKIAIIGGGNSAIDAVRTAQRLMPSGGEVTMIYRRTVAQMPASREEIEELLEENINVLELTAPEEIISANGKVKSIRCSKMELGPTDSSGRQRPVKIANSNFDIELDCIIAAIGQDVDLESVPGDIKLTDWNTVSTDSHQTSLAKVYSGGDLVRGPSSIIKGIADGKEVAFDILKQENIWVPGDQPSADSEIDISALRIKKSKRQFGEKLPKLDLKKRSKFDMVTLTMDKESVVKEAKRCLQCGDLCEICVTVCPNRANISYQAKLVSYSVNDIVVTAGKTSLGDSYQLEINQRNQVANIGDFCNECANCVTFCPSAGKPFSDKPKIYLFKESFAAESSNAYFIKEQGGKQVILAKFNGTDYRMSDEGDHYMFKNENLEGKMDKTTFAFAEILKVKKDGKISIRDLFTMRTLLELQLD